MTLFPAGLIFIILCLTARLRSLSAGFSMTMMTVPFGALALLTLGNFNFLVYHVAFVLLIGIGIIEHFVLRRNFVIKVPELPTLIFLGLMVYALFSAFIMPRIFEGSVMVYSLDGNATGRRASHWFSSQLSPLKPASGNVSQSAYFLLSTAAFMYALASLRSNSASFLNRAITVLAAVNALLGFADFVGMDALLLEFKTAEYAVFDQVRLFDLTRITGGFAEASSMGSFSAAMFAFMFSRYLDTGDKFALALALINLAWALLALSSTGIFAVLVAAPFILLRSVKQNISRRTNSRAFFRLLLIFILGTYIFAAVLVFTNLLETISPFLDRLIFSKGDSLSALERGAWAKQGLVIGVETFGFGAGLGSTRSNGLISVLISNLGIPGLILFLVFLWCVLRKPQHLHMTRPNLISYNAATASLVTILAGRMVAGTTANPGILFLILCAIAIASKPPMYIGSASPLRSPISRNARHVA